MDITGKGFSAVLASRTHGSFHVPGTEGLGHGAGLAVTMRALGLSPGHDCRTDSGCLSSLFPLSDSQQIESHLAGIISEHMESSECNTAVKATTSRCQSSDLPSDRDLP